VKILIWRLDWKIRLLGIAGILFGLTSSLNLWGVIILVNSKWSIEKRLSMNESAMSDE
jgi:hypothetical protein